MASTAATRASESDEVEAGDFLIASRSLLDPNFTKTVILLVAVNDDGAMGVILNRPTKVTLGEMIEELGDSEELPERVWIGGPVASWQLFLLFRTEDGPQDAESVLDGIYFSISREVLESLLESDVEFRIYAGYAGWAPGQLQAEIEREGWHVLPGDPEMVFDRDPSTLWQELIVRGEARWTSHPATAPEYQRAMDQAPGRGRVTFAGHVGQ